MEKEEYVYHLPTSFDGDDFLIGVVISLDKDYDQFHCGLSFDLKNGVHILHLKSHKRLYYNEDWGVFQCYIKPNIHPLRQEAIIPLCYLIRDKIEDEDSQVPYGFNYDEYAFYDLGSGMLHLGSHESGLTCATFVMTLFHSIGIDLIDLSNWPKRPEDDDWEGRTKRLLSQYKVQVNMSKEHLERLKYEVLTGCPRYRPEEVAVSSALYSNQSAPTEDIRAAGARLHRYMYEM